MRIAQLANFVGPTSGGMRRAVDQLGNGYVAAGHDRLLVIPGPASTTTQTEHGTVVQVRSPQVAGGYRLIANLPKVFATLKEFGPTSVEISDKWTLTAVARWARRRGIGSVLFSHERLDDMASDFTGLDVSGAVRMRNRRLAKRFDRVVVTSDYSRGEWKDTDAHLEQVSLGVDAETFHPAATPSVPGEVLQLAYVGRMSKEKYPQLALATALELHARGVPVRMRMIGTGPYLHTLRQRAEGGPVEFVGYLDGREEVAAAYRETDISLSVCPTETFGLAVLEALACGTPVVTASTGGGRELVDESCAEWGSADPASLADAAELLAQRLRRDPAGVKAAARARAELYPWSATVARMIEIHSQVAG